MENPTIHYSLASLQLTEEDPAPVQVVSNGNDSEHGDDLVCAICLENIPLVDMSTVKDCEHMYCVFCILRWASCKEVSRCPQCKKPFNYLYVHRMLDGTISDYPVEESVCLLKRAHWFVDHMRVLEKGKAYCANSLETGFEAAEEFFGFEDEYCEEEDDDEESYYFSSAAGAARVVLGNRRLGENGFMRAGRMYARPSRDTPTPPPKSGGRSKGGKGGGAKQQPGVGQDSGGQASSSAQSPSVEPLNACCSSTSLHLDDAGCSGLVSEVGTEAPVRAPVEFTAEGKVVGGGSGQRNVGGSWRAGQDQSAGTSSGSRSGNGGSGKQGRRAKRSAARRTLLDLDDDYY